MKTILSIIGIVVLGFFLLTAGGISPAMGEINKLGGDERQVMVVSETPSFGTEDWTGTMESSEALGTGALPELAHEKLNLDNYNPD